MLNISALIIFLLSTLTASHAQEINTSNFSGTVNTTVSSGLTIRTERDCSNLDGYSFTSALGTYVDGSGAGCATTLTDDYGNTTSKELSRNSGQTDDGTMNFDEGAVVTAKQKVFTEVIGSMAGGLGVNLSFTGFIDPALDLNSPEYAPLTETAKNDFERGFDLLNAYVYGSSDLANGNYIDWTVGRQVTNWGEATFIPVGMNGFTTNALDLTKLRGPGSSIREALVPTGQITAMTSLGDGISLEAFYQVEHRSVGLDPAGSFYGNEIVGPGSNKMITSGNYNKENITSDDCNYTKILTDTTLCNAATVAEANTLAGDQAYGTTYLLTQGLQATSQTEAALGQGFGVAHVFGGGNLSTAAGAQWTDGYTSALNAILGSKTAAGVAVGGAAIIGTGATGVDPTFFSYNTVGYNLESKAGTTKNSYADDATGAQTAAALAALDTDVSDDSRNTFAAVSIRRSDNFVQEARDDGQFGLRLSGYSDVGEGLDWSLNYSRFHSKTPYVRVKGKGGIYSGDLFGIISKAGDTAEESRSAAQVNLVKAIQNGAYSSGVCNAAMSALLATSTFDGADSDGTYWTAAQALQENYDGTVGNYNGPSTAQKNLSDQYNWGETINGKTVHNSAKCYATATGFTSLSNLALSKGDVDSALDVHASLYGVSEVLISAITPLNLAKYELIFPEDLNAIGLSFNTNISGTAVQGEITYRPEFPLATNVGDQVNQIGDVSGAFDMLDMFAFDTLAKTITANTNNDGTDLDTIVGGAAISPNFYDATIDPTSSATAAVEYLQQGVRMKMLGLATISEAGVVTATGSVLPSDPGKLTLYKNWMGSTNSNTAKYLGLAGVKKGVFDGAYVTACTAMNGGTDAAETTCKSHTLGAGNYNTDYYTGDTFGNTVGGAYEFGTVAFNRSTLPALTKANTVSDYYSTPFIKKDVWSYDLGTTTTFSASHPITASLGADSTALLTEVAAVVIADMNNSVDGYISRNGFQEGMGQEKCNGPFGALVAGGTSFGGAAGGITHLGAGQVDALFGNGGYCESQNGADDFSLSYRVIGTATYNNFNNSGWSLSPTVVWAHDPHGYGPASLGGFVEDKMTMSLSLNAKKGAAITMGVNYTSQLHGPEVDASTDKDTVTASISYAF
jgi:hypothetical protein